MKRFLEGNRVLPWLVLAVVLASYFSGYLIYRQRHWLVHRVYWHPGPERFYHHAIQPVQGMPLAFAPPWQQRLVAFGQKLFLLAAGVETMF